MGVFQLDAMALVICSLVLLISETGEKLIETKQEIAQRSYTRISLRKIDELLNPVEIGSQHQALATGLSVLILTWNIGA